MARMFKEKRNKIRISADVDMLLRVERGIRGGICHATDRYAKANKKYMKNYHILQRIIKSHVFRCKQFVWMGECLKIACRWF